LAHNSFIHGGLADPTAWLAGYVPTQLDFQLIDQYLFESINGDVGGVWAPATVIEIGGAGLAVVTSASGNFTVSGAAGSINFYSGDVIITPTNVTFSGGVPVIFDDGISADIGSTSIVGDLNVNGAQLTVAAVSFFNDDIFLAANKDFVAAAGTGQFDFFGGTVTISTALGLQVGGGVPASFGAGVDIAGTLDIGSGDILLDSSSLTCTVPASFSDATNFSAGVTFTSAGSVALAGPVSLTGIITPSGVGRLKDRVYTLPDATVTVSIADGSYFVVPALGATRTYTLSTTGAQLGDRVCFDAWANSTANIAGVGPWNLQNATGVEVVVWFRFDGSVWQKSDVTFTP